MSEIKCILTMQRPAGDPDIFIYEETPEVEKDVELEMVRVFGKIAGHEYKSNLWIERSNIAAFNIQPVTKKVALNIAYGQLGMEGVKLFCEKWEIDFEAWKKENNVWS